MDIQTADAFHSARENFDWAGEDSEKSAAIVRAQDFIATYYTLKPDTPVDHPLLVRAVMFLALQFIRGFDPIKQEANVTRSKIVVEGVVTEEYEYGDAPDPTERYPFVTHTLRPILAGGSTGLTMMRIVR